MRFLPVVQRELRTAARRPLTYWIRFFCGLLSSVFLAWFWFMGRASISSATGGRDLFNAIAGLAYAYSFGIGLVITSDCLSEEKREGTLGLLFLTDLRGYDVVLGKLAATSMHAFYGLLAVFPLLAIPLLLGGLTSGEFWRMLLVLTNTLFLSLTAGLAVSALSRSARMAKAGTLILLLVMTAGAPLFGAIYASVHRKPYDPMFSVPSSAYAFAQVPDKAYGISRQEFWTSNIFTAGCAMSCLILGSFAAPRSWQDKPAGAKLNQLLDKWKMWSLGAPMERKSFRGRLLDENAFFWLAARQRAKPACVFSFLGVAAVVWCWLSFQYPDSMLDTSIYITTGLFLHTTIKLWLASEAGRVFCEDRRTGALELILCTPLTIREVLSGQVLALKRQFGGALGAILFVDFCMVLAGLRHHYSGIDSSWVLPALAGMTMFVLDIFALTWVGMWLGLTSKKPGRAAAGTVARILILPWGIFFLFLTIGSLTNMQGRFTEGDMLLAVWFLISFFLDLFFFAWARTNLYQQFRTIATQRFEQSRTHWWNLSLWIGAARSAGPVPSPLAGDRPRTVE